MKRRQLLVWLAATSAAACGKPFKPADVPDEEPPSMDPPTNDPPRVDSSSLIPAENLKPGDPQWRAGRRAFSGEVDVYLSVDSASAGESISVMISSDVASSVQVDVYRIGHYGGAGARKVWSAGVFNVSRQRAPTPSPATGLVDCDWTPTLSFSVGTDWLSGLYLVKVRRADDFKRFAPFVVRDGRPADILCTTAFNTYQAYNAWGGLSLYRDDTGTMPRGRAFQVSYNRPYTEADGAGFMLYQEAPFVRFLEKNGYNATYATNADFSRFSNLLNGIGLLAIAGHDEYWTVEQRAQVDAALAFGRMSLAYFSANGCFWRVRYEGDGRGNPYRTVTCYKSDPALDPIPNSTIRFRDPPNAMPENRLFGIMYESWQHVNFPFSVSNPNHWLFEGTGLRTGDVLPSLATTEFDHVFPGSPADTTIIMENPVVSEQGTPGVSQVVERTLQPAGNTVFAAGTIGWSNGLNPDSFGADDDRLARMTLNVLERGLTFRRPQRALDPAGATRPPNPVIIPLWAQSVEAFAGTVLAPGRMDGPGSSARFRGPTGLASNLSGQIVVADTNNHCIRLIDNDASHTVRTIAGSLNGIDGFNDGPGANALFRKPNAVAMAPDGSILVADSENHVIRRIEFNPPTWTVSTYAGTPGTPGFADGPAASARFNRPTGIAIDPLGNVFVSEVGGCRLRQIRGDTRQVSTYAGNGILGARDASLGTAAQFAAPSAVAVGPGGEVYVLDCFSQWLRRISPAAGNAVVTIAGAPDIGGGQIDGIGTDARLRGQLGMLSTPSGDLIIADSANFRIRRVRPGVDAASTRLYTMAGSGRRGTRLGPCDVADIVAPTGLTLAPNGRLMVSDSYNHVIRSILL